MSKKALDVVACGAHIPHMKHGHLMDNSDKAELGKAITMIDQGRKLKRRVQNRLRMRAIRMKGKTDE